MGKKSKLRRLGASLKQRASKAKQDAITVKRMISVGKKLRWTSEGIAGQMIRDLNKKSKRYQTLSLEDKRKVDSMVFEECAKQPEYKAKELVGLARRIEKRFKKEFD
jgi:hypothetical protein